MGKSSKREHLIETALRLFYEGGFHAVGIDAIIAASGVAKTTLYKYFPSKEDLIIAVLRRRDEWGRQMFVQGINKVGTDARSKLLAAFDVFEQWFASDAFCGCMFVNAAAEFPQISDAAHVIAAEHKRLFTKIIRDLCQEAGARAADDMAEELMLLLDGATVSAQVRRDPVAAQIARRTANLIIKRYLDHTSSSGEADGRCRRP